MALLADGPLTVAPETKCVAEQGPGYDQDEQQNSEKTNSAKVCRQCCFGFHTHSLSNNLPKVLIDKMSSAIGLNDGVSSVAPRRLPILMLDPWAKSPG